MFLDCRTKAVAHIAEDSRRESGGGSEGGWVPKLVF